MVKIVDPVLDHLLAIASAPDEDFSVTGDATESRFDLPLTCVGDRFDVAERLGEGGMGTVYRARDRQTGRSVAVKILHHGDSAGELRFGREIEALAELAHPSIVAYVAHGGAGTGLPFVAMELLEGESLWERLHREPITVAETVRIGLPLASALSAAHRRELVHRDVKPSNVILCHDGAVKLVDFGLVRPVRDRSPVTLDGYATGTQGYMAPEQVRGDRDIDARADVFALGCLLYHCLAGQAPPHTSEPRVPLRTLRPDVPEALESLIDDMLADNRAFRPAHAGVVLLRFAALLRFPELDVLRVVPGNEWGSHCLGRRTALHGRDAEREWIKNQVRADGGGCLLVGPPGIGKTRLAMEAVSEVAAETGAWTFVRAGSQGEPLSLLSKVVRFVCGVTPTDGERALHRKIVTKAGPTLVDPSAVEELARLAGSPGAVRPDVAEAVFSAWALREWSEAPWRLVLDDLAGADAASLHVLATVLRGLERSHRPRVVALARPAVSTRHPGLADRFGIAELSLKGIDAGAVAALAEDILGEGGAALVRRDATASPLQVIEQLRAHVLGVRAPSPDSLEARVEAKIGALSPYSRWVLRAASLFEDSFTEPQIVAVIGQRDAPAVRRALVELALFDVVAAGASSTYRLKNTLDRDVARRLASEGDLAIGARLVSRLLS